MSNQESIYGTIGWIDLTAPNADGLKDFYAQVAGWTPEPVSMGDYNDYNMTSDGVARAGVCHKKGLNSEIPTQWMIYINVPDLNASCAACTANGGELMGEIREAGSMGRFCIIKDPAGAVCALFEPPKAQ